MTEPKIDAKEAEFQSKNQWYSFTATLYNALGGAAFIGLLGMLAQTLVKASTSAAATTEALALVNPVPLAVIGSMMAVGTACLYMSQREATKLKTIQDTHLAEENARCAGQGKAPAHTIAHEPEHEQNCRSDGKKWVDAVAANQNLAIAR